MIGMSEFILLKPQPQFDYCTLTTKIKTRNSAVADKQRDAFVQM